MTLSKKTDRRDFIKISIKGSVVAGMGMSAAGSLLESCSATKSAVHNNHIFTTGFTQTPLPYTYAALENVIDTTTMEIHYTKHAAAYSKNLQEAVQAEAPTAKSVEDLLASISKYSTKMRNNSGGHYNHEFFWQCMRPVQNDNKPSGKLLAAIENTFTSFANFRTQFSDAGKNRFGSGWAWLYLDNNKGLKIGSTPNQDNPLMDISELKGVPILGLDVWEHAYYLKYQQKRADYIENWWKVVNWDFIYQRYEKLV